MGVWRARKRKNEKWKLIYIWTMLNMNDWLQSFFRTALFTFSSTLFTCSIFIQPRRAFLMCRRGPINVKKPQTKWQLQNANCTFCLLPFFCVHCMLSCLLSCVTWNCLLALWYAMNARKNGMDDDAIQKKEWTHLQI